jgi:hypothetical protein
VVRLSALLTGRIYPPGNTPGTISVRGWVDPTAAMRSEGYMSTKNSKTPSGIETATFWFVAHYLNHPLLQWKSNKYHIFWVCVSSFRYQACNCHGPYYIVICSLSDSVVFLSQKGTSYWTQNVFWFYLKFCLKLFHTKKNWATYCYTRILVSM